MIQKSKSHEIPLFFLYVLYIKREMRDREKERKRKMKEWKKIKNVNHMLTAIIFESFNCGILCGYKKFPTRST
jgi:hypothetical protein